MILLPLVGSSPRMRGARAIANIDRLTVRIIPAYAGSTLVIAWIHGVYRDHPRVCGEHLRPQFVLP